MFHLDATRVKNGAADGEAAGKLLQSPSCPLKWKRRSPLCMTLSPMQQLFVQEYLVDLNATQAAIRAGYSPATARSQGQRLLTIVDIEEEIKCAMERRAERTGITADRVLQELAAIGFASIGDYLTTEENGNHRLNFAKLTRAEMAGITDVKIESDSCGRRKIQIKMRDKLAALVLMGRHLDRVTEAAGHFGPAEESQMPRLANAMPDREGPNPLPTTAMTGRRGGQG